MTEMARVIEFLLSARETWLELMILAFADMMGVNQQKGAECFCLIVIFGIAYGYF